MQRQSDIVLHSKNAKALQLISQAKNLRGRHQLIASDRMLPVTEAITVSIIRFCSSNHISVVHMCSVYVVVELLSFGAVNRLFTPQNCFLGGFCWPRKWGAMWKVSPKSTSLRKSASFEPSCVKIRRRVWPIGEFPKRNINKNNFGYISPMCPEVHRGRICT